MKFRASLVAVCAALLVLAIGVPVSAATPIGTQTTLAGGEYLLVPACASTRAVTIKNGSTSSGANALIYKNHKWAKQIFVISSAGNGLYRIRNKNSGKYLEVKGGSSSNKANIRQKTKNKLKRQKWFITRKGSYYVIQASYSSTQVMTVAGAKNKNRTNVYSYRYYGSKGQLWTLVPYGTTATAQKTGTGSSKKLTALAGYKTSSRKWDDKKDYAILTNIIGAVESGGQVYGNRNYAAYTPPGKNSALELTITLGWAQFYGNEAQKLVKSIYKKDTAAFKKIDKKGLIQKAMKKNWVASKWNPNATEKALLIALISSKAGKACQDAQFQAQMKEMVEYARKTYTDNAWAVLMYCEIRHLGGQAAAARIFDRCQKNYSLGMIMASLKADQADTSSSNQVGDSKFWSRHVKCAAFAQYYAA